MKSRLVRHAMRANRKTVECTRLGARFLVVLENAECARKLNRQNHIDEHLNQILPGHFLSGLRIGAGEENQDLTKSTLTNGSRLVKISFGMKGVSLGFSRGFARMNADLKRLSEPR